jgi:hypothetical protein
MNAQRWQIVSKARRGIGTAMFEVADQHPQAALRIAVIGYLLEAPQDVQFNQPVFFYVENFLNLPIGETVPVGAYDNTRGTWQATPNGRVLKLLGIPRALLTWTSSAMGSPTTVLRSPRSAFSTRSVRYSHASIRLESAGARATEPLLDSRSELALWLHHQGVRRAERRKYHVT